MKTCSFVPFMIDKMQKPFISVVMPVYNTQAYVGEAIESILHQTFTNFEFIIIDDESTDNSREIIKQYAKEDKRIKAERNTRNIGVVQTRNKLIKKIHPDSQYMAIMDSDDIAMPQRIEEQVIQLEKDKKVAAIGSHIYIINQSSKVIATRIYPITQSKIKKSILRKNPLAQPGTTVRIDSLKKVGGYDNNFERCQDYELRTRFFSQGYKLANINKFLTKYRISDSQGKKTHLKTSLQNTITIKKKYIFQKQHINFVTILYRLLENILLIFPDKFIYCLFKKVRYKKTD